MNTIQVIVYQKDGERYMIFHVATSIRDAREFRRSHLSEIKSGAGYHVMHDKDIDTPEKLKEYDPYFKQYEKVTME